MQAVRGGPGWASGWNTHPWTSRVPPASSQEQVSQEQESQETEAETALTFMIWFPQVSSTHCRHVLSVETVIGLPDPNRGAEKASWSGGARLLL